MRSSGELKQDEAFESPCSIDILLRTIKLDDVIYVSLSLEGRHCLTSDKIDKD